MPNYSGIWSLPQQMQAKGADNWTGIPVYFIATMGSTSTDIGYSVTTDNLSNIYITGQTNVSGLDYVYIAKFDEEGSPLWQKTLSNPSNNSVGFGIKVDSSGNVYVVNRVLPSGTYACSLAKYNSSGVLQWQRFLQSGATNIPYGVDVDSSGNIYMAGGTNNTSYEIFLAKYNSSGTIQWQRKLGTSTSDIAYSVKVDNAGYVCIAGQTTQSAGNDAYLAKYDSSGNLQWQTKLSSASGDIAYGLSIDSSDNLYIGGSANNAGSGGLEGLIAKYNSSGTLQWQRVIGGSGSDQIRGISVDGLGNSYVCGYQNSDVIGGYDFLIAKYDTSGTIQWQRKLGTVGNDYARAIWADSLGSIYVTGNTDTTVYGSNDIILAKLPSDGSLTGTYGSWTYAASSLTPLTSSLTSSAGGLTSSVLSLTDSAGTLTDASISLGITVTTL